ncbi:MAG: GNAT family N-acetyltransferase [Spirochaetaceae bacterium]|nr:GNAT family N-acetyltransferase [Spirochaetaceae bacterium]
MGDFVLKRVDHSTMQKAYSFVLEHEAFCVTLSSEFAQNSQFKAVYAVYGKADICGVITVNSSGFALHCLPDVQQLEQDLEFVRSLEKALGAEKISTIMGEEAGTKLLQRLYPAHPDCVWDYNLLEYDGAKLDFTLPVGVTLKKCAVGDEESLYPLQKQYELVEVLPPGTEHNPARCRLGLQKSLEKQIVFALFADERAVAKAGTNAIGINFAQIGGVFTDAAFRNRGFATFLTNYAAQRLSEKGKRVILFVKKKNESAKRAYAKAGFAQFGTFRIVYY